MGGGLQGMDGGSGLGGYLRMLDFLARLPSMTGFVNAWSSKGNVAVSGSRGLWSGFKRLGSLIVKAVHSLSGGICIEMAISQ